MDSDTVNLVAADTYWGVGVYQLGYKMLEGELRAAGMALMYGLTSEEATEAVVFVEGTGLEMMMERFGLDSVFSADKLRDSLHTWVEQRSDQTLV